MFEVSSQKKYDNSCSKCIYISSFLSTEGYHNEGWYDAYLCYSCRAELSIPIIKLMFGNNPSNFNWSKLKNIYSFERMVYVMEPLPLYKEVVKMAIAQGLIG